MSHKKGKDEHGYKEEKANNHNRCSPRTHTKNEQPLYLEPNSESMQKPIGGRSVLTLFTTKRMLENNSQKFVDSFPCTGN